MVTSQAKGPRLVSHILISGNRKIVFGRKFLSACFIKLYGYFCLKSDHVLGHCVHLYVRQYLSIESSSMDLWTCKEIFRFFLVANPEVYKSIYIDI